MEFLFICILLSLLPTSWAEGVDLNLDTDKREWVDVMDPFSDELTSNSLGAIQKCETRDELIMYKREIERLVAANQALRSKKSESVDVLLKHILRKFLLQLDVKLTEGHNVDKFARVYLSSSDVATLMAYLKSEKHLEEVAMREKVRAALENFITAEVYQEESGLIVTIRKLVPFLFVLNIIFLPFAIFNVFRSILGPRNFFVFVLIASFCVSYYFTYIRKYQEVLADRFQRVHSPTDACSPKGLISEAVGVLLSYVKIKGKDQCLQKYEDMLVEPFLLVDPLQVFGEVMTNFLMSPFSVLGIHLNKFFNDFFIDTPIFLVLVKLIFIALVLFYLSGYRIYTIFGTIEPTYRPPPPVQRVEQRVQYHSVTDGPQTVEVFDAIESTTIPLRSTSQRPQRHTVTNERPQRHTLTDERPQRNTVTDERRPELLDNQMDEFDLPQIVNLDDSNVTRRRKPKNRSQSLPKCIHNLDVISP